MIRYDRKETRFVFKGRRENNSWLRSVADEEGKKIGEIAVVFCSDEYLLSINKQFLSHDYYTDIITFDYCEEDLLNGDLLISVDSVRDNASYYSASFDEELHRVIVHGLLHLIGYDDHTPEDQKIMRAKEDYYLCKRNTI